MNHPGHATRAGFAAIVGRPNVGKSTLLNALLGTKVAIVSHHAQTTRNRITGVKTRGALQVVFVDTPGIHRSRAGMNRYMIKEAISALDRPDCVLLLTEVRSSAKTGAAEKQKASADQASPPEAQSASDPQQLAPAASESLLHPDDRYVLEQVRDHARNAPLILVINKVDTMRDRRWLLPLMDRWRQAGFERIVPVSALNAEGLDRLMHEVEQLMPPGPHLYPEDMLTDQAERFLAAELVREQIFRHTHQEVPYAIAVEVERFEERATQRDVVIHAAIFVEREGQKAILIGGQGRQIKEVGTRAREQIAALLGCPVHLKLTVLVARDWTRSPSGRQRFGYE